MSRRAAYVGTLSVQPNVISFSGKAGTNADLEKERGLCANCKKSMG